MEAQQQTQQPQYKYNPYRIMRDSSDSSIIYLTDPEDELRRLELTLRGLYETSDGQIRRYGQPLMNEFGIQTLLGLERSVVSQINILGHEDKDEIVRIMLDFLKRLTEILMVNRVKFGLTYENRMIVKTLAKYPPYFALKRSFNGGERNFWRGSQQEILHKIENSIKNPSTGNFISRLFGR